MSQATVTERKEIRWQDVVSVYSGKPGCCCGCKGKHTHSPIYPEDHNGYTKVDATVVRRHVATINRALAMTAAERKAAGILEVQWATDGRGPVVKGYVGVYTDSRWVIAYLAR